MTDEYIRRAEALEITTRTCGDYAAAFAEIRKLPAADVAEVVRCKDCKHGELYERNDGETGVYCNCSNSIFKYANEHTFTPVRDVDDFCSYGLRKRRYNALPELRCKDGWRKE